MTCKSNHSVWNRQQDQKRAVPRCTDSLAALCVRAVLAARVSAESLQIISLVPQFIPYRFLTFCHEKSVPKSTRKTRFVFGRAVQSTTRMKVLELSIHLAAAFYSLGEPRSASRNGQVNLVLTIGNVLEILNDASHA